MTTILESVKFRSILALAAFAAIVSALVLVPTLNGQVAGAFIAIITLIAQFYFRKAPAGETASAIATTIKQPAESVNDIKTANTATSTAQPDASKVS